MPTTNSLKHINLTYLESISEGDNDIIKELIEIFIEQVPEFTEGLADNYSQRNWKQIASISHKAKSSVISMGMEQLGNIDLKNLELLAKKRKISELEQTNFKSEELDKLLTTLKSYPSDRQQWIEENNNDQIIEQLIYNFTHTCNEAVKELQSVLKRL